MPHGKVAIVLRGLFKPLRGRQGPGVTEYTILLAALVFGSTTAIGTVVSEHQWHRGSTKRPRKSAPTSAPKHQAGSTGQDGYGMGRKTDSQVTCRGAGAGSADHWALDK